MCNFTLPDIFIISIETFVISIMRWRNIIISRSEEFHSGGSYSTGCDYLGVLHICESYNSQCQNATDWKFQPQWLTQKF